MILNRKCAAHTFSVYNYFDSNEEWFHAVKGERKIYKHAFTFLPNEVFLCNSFWKPLKFCDEDINVNGDMIHIS